MKKQGINQLIGAFLAIVMLLQVSTGAVFALDTEHEESYPYQEYEDIVQEDDIFDIDDIFYVDEVYQLHSTLEPNIPIIVIPGIAGTEMRNPANSVLQLVWINILWHFQGHLEQLALDVNGNPLINTVHPVSTGYGANDTYRTLLRALRAEFGSDMVHFWGYDWRLDNAYNAVRLHEFIDSLNVPRVNIVAHSMGGLISARYIADGHGDRINTLITLGTPFLGSPRVPYIFATGNLVEIPILPGPRNGVRNVSSHMLSAYQMLPFESPYRYIGVGERTGMLWWSSLNWDYVDNEFDFIRNMLPMRGIENSQVPSSVRANFLDRAPQFIESTFIGDIHAMETVNSHVIVGDNIPTVHTTIFNRNGDFIEYLNFTRGDGTVPIWSQNINGRINTISFNYEHTALTRQPRVINEIIRLIYGIGAMSEGDIAGVDPFVVISATSAVDITISDGNQRLSSEDAHFNTITNFGALHFIGPEGQTPLLALVADATYEIFMTGIANDTMDYSIRFYDNNLNFVEERRFLNVPITHGTIITTNTSQEEGTTLSLTLGRNRAFNIIIQPDYIYHVEDGLTIPN
ncbi:MAG: alpha/beta fold hydrolase [Defluviitaleaceae bacterium]|nr:alpha/beta fold hydrolase [Defluviitaleaceae bacterium]